ncbi:MAG: hypothetical protein ACTSQF_00085 [Candidatus Heimdallarchaeaceae archaeon]
MNGFIKISVEYVPKDMSAELANDLDMYEEGFLYIRPEYIMAFNENSKGKITFRTNDGDAWIADMSIDEFVKQLP